MRILEDSNTEKTLENLRARNRSDNENSREPDRCSKGGQVCTL